MQAQRVQMLSFGGGDWIGPAPRPAAMGKLPAKATSGAGTAGGMLAAAGVETVNVADSSDTNAVAFRIYDNNIPDWATDSGMSGDWDGDGKDDILGWSGSGWRSWHADGLSSNQLNFSAYTNDLPAAMTDATPDPAGRFRQRWA